MKRSLAVVSFAMMTTSALASSTAGIYDLQYLPNAGTVYGESEYSVNELSTMTDGDKSKVNSNEFTQSLGYSVTDRLLLTASMGYLLDQTTSEERVEQGSKDGLSDPTISARVRLMDQADGGWNFDVLPSWTIETGDAESGSGNKDGNNYGGGHVFGLGLNLGKKEKTHQYVLFLDSALAGKSESEDVETKEKTTTESTSFLTLGARGLWNISESAYVSGFLSATRFSESESKSDGEKTTSNARNAVNFGAEIGVAPTQNTLISFALSATEVLDHDIESDGADDVTVEKQRAASGVLRARYQF
jgi:hypothetical protein